MPDIILSLKCAVAAFVYSEILIQQGHVLYPLYRLFERILITSSQQIQPDSAPEEVRSMPGYVYKPVVKMIVKRHWLLKPLGECHYCTAGQLTMWAFNVKYFLLPHLSPVSVKIIGTAWNIASMVCLSIFMVIILKKVYESGKRT